jgi:hypothetical protein
MNFEIKLIYVCVENEVSRRRMSGAMPCRHTRAYAVAQAQPSFCYTGHVVPSSLSYWVNPRHGGGGKERRRATMEGKDGEAWWSRGRGRGVEEQWCDAGLQGQGEVTRATG